MHLNQVPVSEDNNSTLMQCLNLLDNTIIEPKMSASFVPDHKAPMVLFLDRVYGIDNQDFLLHVLEVGFLPDMRAAASLDTVSGELCDSYESNHLTTVREEKSILPPALMILYL